ncbi:MAG: hypothetical protein JXA68_04760 [Ignavibacteriales bacterium]|nr:hypothetical protein [Ignavibacteriales bacterium]
MMKKNNVNKENLELEKLKQEIKNLKRSKFDWIYKIATIIIAFLSITYAWQSDLFNVQSQRLEIDKKILEYDIRIFTAKRDSISSQLDNYKNYSDSLEKQYKAKLQSEIVLLKKNGEYLKIINIYERKIDSLFSIKSKTESSQKYLTTKNGAFITTEDGQKIIIK